MRSVALWSFLLLLGPGAGCGASGRAPPPSSSCTDPSCSDGAATSASPPEVGCTLVGCNDGASITLDSPTGSWAAGSYELQASGDGAMVTCTLNIPASATNDVFGTCTTAGASLSLEFAQTCMTLDAGIPGVTGVQCTPIEGQTSLRLEVPGTPASLMLAVQRGGAPLASKSLDLQYTAFYPNGRACGGACQEASVTLTVADAGSPVPASSDGAADGGPDASRP